MAFIVLLLTAPAAERWRERESEGERIEIESSGRGGDRRAGRGGGVSSFCYLRTPPSINLNEDEQPREPYRCVPAV